MIKNYNINKKNPISFLWIKHETVLQIATHKRQLVQLTLFYIGFGDESVSIYVSSRQDIFFAASQKENFKKKSRQQPNQKPQDVLHPQGFYLLILFI